MVEATIVPTHCALKCNIQVEITMNLAEAEYLMFLLRHAKVKWRKYGDFHAQTRDEEIRAAIHQALDIAGVS